MDARETILDALDALTQATGSGIASILKDLNSYFMKLENTAQQLLCLTENFARLRPIVKMYTMEECQDDLIVGKHKVWVISADCVEDIRERKYTVHNGDTIPHDDKYKELCLGIARREKDAYTFNRLLFFSRPYQENGTWLARNEFTRFSGYIQNLIYSRLRHICELLDTISESLIFMYKREQEKLTDKRKKTRRRPPKTLKFEELLKSKYRPCKEKIRYILEKALKAADTRTVADIICILIDTGKMSFPHNPQYAAYTRLFNTEFQANITSPDYLRKCFPQNFEQAHERVLQIARKEPYKYIIEELFKE